MGLDAIGLAMAVEQTFDLKIPDEDYERFVTVRALCDYIVLKKPGLNWDKVLETVRQITVDELAVKPEEVQPETRWIEDLKID